MTPEYDSHVAKKETQYLLLSFSQGLGETQMYYFKRTYFFTFSHNS